MRKRLTMALVAGALVTAMLPGVASAEAPTGYMPFVMCYGERVSEGVVDGWPPEVEPERPLLGSGSGPCEHGGITIVFG